MATCSPATPFFRAIKNKYPLSHLTLIVSPANKDAVHKNKYIDRVVIFNKKHHANPLELTRFLSVLREEYDWVLVPVTVSISFTSNLMAGITRAKLKVGPNYLDGVFNESSFFFNKKINFDWRIHPDLKYL